MAYDDIRARLAALLTSGEIQRTREEEYYGDWARLGPLMILAPNEHDLALLDAIRHAAADIHTLLTELDARQ
jgi:hypothetical protein